MRLPIDTSAVSFVSAGPPEVAVDFDTKVPKTDATGKTIYNVYLFCVGAGSRDTLTVKIAGEPKGLGEFTPVKVRELVANTWTKENRSGVSFRAASVEVVAPARSAS